MRLMPSFSDANEIEGRVTDADKARHEKQVRKGRIETARRNDNWVELEEADLFERGRGLLVSAASDQVFTVYRGVAFAPASINMIAAESPLRFYVCDDDELVFLEKQHGTWSQRVERQARKEAARR